MKLEVNCELQCAHKLTCVAEGSRCRRLHGHTYYVKVVVGGYRPDPEKVIIDVDEVREVIMQLDHSYLNERLPELGFSGEPTLENLVYALDQLVTTKLSPGVEVVQVEVQEGSGGIARLG